MRASNSRVIHDAYPVRYCATKGRSPRNFGICDVVKNVIPKIIPTDPKKIMEK